MKILKYHNYEKQKLDVNKNTAHGYLTFKKFANYNSKDKDDFYGSLNCMEKIRKNLKSRILETIKNEQKELLPWSLKKMNHEKICQAKFYFKKWSLQHVSAKYHFAGRYRGTAHEVCN